MGRLWYEVKDFIEKHIDAILKKVKSSCQNIIEMMRENQKEHLEYDSTWKFYIYK